MVLRDFQLNHYLFGTTAKELDHGQRRKVKASLKREMADLFYGKTLLR